MLCQAEIIGKPNWVGDSPENAFKMLKFKFDYQYFQKIKKPVNTFM